MANKNNSANLQLHLDSESSINSICKAFTINYPFLKIYFLKKGFKGELCIKGLLSNIELSKRFGISYNEKKINVDKTRTVFEVGKDLENLLGLSVLIFRKSGNVWVETSLTEDWTLEDQNEAGKQISCHFY